MFNININKTNSSIIIQNNESIDIAKGKFLFDRPDSTLLVIIYELTVDFNDIELFLSKVLSFLSEYYKARVFLRLPMLDHHSKLNQIQVSNQPSTAMIVSTAKIIYQNPLEYNQNNYEFIFDKDRIQTYANDLFNLINKNAPWVIDLTLKDIDERIQTSERLIMILDRTKNVPCAFGRLLLINKTNEFTEQIGYVDDIIVDSDYQGQGFGWKITNYLMGITTQIENLTLCLACVDEGIGALVAPKLYLKFGFQFVNQLQNDFAIFVTEQFFPHH